MRLEAHGIVARLPVGWEGTIGAEEAPPASSPGTPSPVQPRGTGDDHAQAFAGHGFTHEAYADEADRPEIRPVAHFATFGLPAVRSDFGGAAVILMDVNDVFVALVEYSPQDAGSALFASHGLPRRLDPGAFSARTLQRRLRGQAGFQHFFSEAGRAFCLYVVLGSARNAARLVPRAEQVLASVEIRKGR